MVSNRSGPSADVIKERASGLENVDGFLRHFVAASHGRIVLCIGGQRQLWRWGNLGRSSEARAL